MDIKTLINEIPNSNFKIVKNKIYNLKTLNSEDYISQLNEIKIQKKDFENINEKDIKDIMSNGLEIALGNNYDGSQLIYNTCSNKNKGNVCNNKAKNLCGRCRIVFYCSKECQIDHWEKHKNDCKNELTSTNWEPEYIIQKRLPSSMNGLNEYVEKNKLNYGMHLYGNTIAYDIINYNNNEGIENINNLNCLFLASGDLRNILLTIINLPNSIKCNIFVNDHNPKIVFRNLLILFLLNKYKEDSIDMVINLWYSIFITHDQNLCIMQNSKDILKCLINEYENSWFKTCFTDDENNKFLIEYYMISQSLNVPYYEAINMLREKLSGYINKDNIENHYKNLNPFHRVIFKEYRTFGTLLPFGAFTSNLASPNMTMFHNKEFILQNSSDPMEGWDYCEVLKFAKNKNIESNDFYGNLYFYLRNILEKFIIRMNKNNIKIHLYNKDAMELCDYINNIKFDRIDTSNIVDIEYLGLNKILKKCEKSINNKNKYSTILTYFMNWIKFYKDELTIKNINKMNKNNKKIEEIIKKYDINKSNPKNMLNIFPSLLMELCDDIYIDIDLNDVLNKYFDEKNNNDTNFQRKKKQTIHTLRNYGNYNNANKLKLNSEEKYNLAYISRDNFYDIYIEWK